MPIMDGLEFLEAYQHLPLAQPPVVIVMLTTSVSPRYQACIAHLPVADFVSKPLTQEKLDTILQLHFQPRFRG
ncbi:hypothetical protein GCM10027346_40530 [Hymenobacter seoulensis]